MISVIVPVYNVKQFINQCIESIVSQTFKDIEIILVDDGSTDGSSEICDLWATKDERVRVIHQSNGGLSCARNKGIANANGEYIGFVDSDDWVSPYLYQRLHELINLGEYDIASCSFLRLVEANSYVQDNEGLIKEYTQREFLKELLKVGTQNSNQYAWNKLYRREILDDEQYPEGLTDEDVVGTLKAVIKSKKNIICSSEKLYFYRINQNSITGPSFSDSKWDYLVICDRAKALINEKIDDDDIKYWADMFRARADFGVLCRLMVMKIEKCEYAKQKSRIEKSVRNLKMNMKRLLRFDWPLSRKILMIFMVANYGCTRSCIKFLMRGKQNI